MARKKTFEELTKRTKYFAVLDEEIKRLVDPKTGLLAQRFAKILPCPVCRSERYKMIFIKRGYTFVRCISCGHIFTNPQVKEDILQESYKDSLANELWTDVLFSKEEQKWRGDYFNGVLDIIEHFCPKGKILDIGCSIGTFLGLAIRRGWQGTGIDLGRKAYLYCKERGLHVFQKRLEDCDFKPREFHVITAFSLLEHLNDPRRFLRLTQRYLRSQGLLVAVVPNAHSLAAMLLREKLLTFDGRNHLQYFSMASLKKLFTICGFRVLHSDTVLTALPNIKKYIQYLDPYGPEQKKDFIPEKLSVFLNDTKKCEKFMANLDLGLKLRIVARLMA